MLYQSGIIIRPFPVMLKRKCRACFVKMERLSYFNQPKWTKHALANHISLRLVIDSVITECAAFNIIMCALVLFLLDFWYIVQNEGV